MSTRLCIYLYRCSFSRQRAACAQHGCNEHQSHLSRSATIDLGKIGLLKQEESWKIAMLCRNNSRH